MTLPTRYLLPLTFALAALVSPAFAGPSSAASSASDSITASVGRLSGSVQASSNSSSGDRRVAEGDYRLIEIAEDTGRPDMLRLALAPLQDGAAGGAEPFVLTVPRETVGRTPELVAGTTVHVAERPYGFEFAQGKPRQAFFLALHDDWYRELRTTPVGL
ncbi:hypothetical protein [Piscinibacter sakaiensis]|uniref:hypothetical protein n=1 Tax=Piscinibacter sakaiensis TaxID=1547922 RepID=UPI003AAB0FC0